MQILRHISVAIPAACLLASAVRAADRLVPAHYPTIQGAVDAALAGDSVLLASGTYAEAVTIVGKSLTIAASPGATCALAPSNGAAITIRQATFGGGVTIRGIAVEGCQSAAAGAAIRAEESVVSIIECAIRNNRLDAGNSVSGGGAIYAADSTLTIDSCQFLGNTAFVGTVGEVYYASPRVFGGAVFGARATVNVRRSSFADNRCVATVPSAQWAEVWAQGGAIAVQDGTLDVQESSFMRNTAAATTAGIGPIARASGGAVYASRGNSSIATRVTGSRFFENETISDSGNWYYSGTGDSRGAAVYLANGSGPGAVRHAISNCWFFGSRATKFPGNRGRLVSDIFNSGDRDSVEVAGCSFGGSIASSVANPDAVPALVADEYPSSPASLLRDSAICQVSTSIASGWFETSNLVESAFCADCDLDGQPDLAAIALGCADADHDGRLDSCPCSADLNSDRSVDGADIGLLLFYWGPAVTESWRADINRDGAIDGADLGLLLSFWGSCS